MFTGEEHASVVGSLAADEHRAVYVVADDSVYDKSHKPVVEQYFIAFFHRLGYEFIRHRNAGFVTDYIVGRKREFVSFFKSYTSVFVSPRTELGTLGIEHYRQRDMSFFSEFFYYVYLFKLFFVRTVRKIKPAYVHTRVEHRGNCLFSVAGRSQRTNDFSFFHKITHYYRDVYIIYPNIKKRNVNRCVIFT